ncbi:MAG TPA: hypothetical protein VE985_06745 [Gaiellaceae bacterium]|nr:hypothetical protein [Gaiellaceae bacterium]
MKITEEIRHLFSATATEKLAARAEAETRRAKAEGDASASANNMAGPYRGY